MAKENVKIFSENVNTATKSIKSLRQELKELKDAMTNVDEGSEEFYKLADKAGAIQHQISEITETVRGASADFGIMLSNSMQAFNGIIGGLQAVQGAMQFFGYESESLVKTMSQLQGLMAVGQGISQIDNAIKAIDRLRVAITGTTKTAKLLRSVLQPKVFLGITAAISALLLIWNKWGDSIKEHIPFLSSISEKWKEITGNAEDATKAQEDWLKNLKDAEEKYNAFVESQQVKKLNSEQKKSYDELKESVKGLELYLEVLTAKEKRVGIGKKAFDELDAEATDTHNKINELKKAINDLLDNPLPEPVKKVEESAGKMPKFMGILSDAMERYKATIDSAKESASSWFTDLDTWNAKLEQQYKSGAISEEEYYNGLLDNAKRALYATTEGTKEYYDALSKVDELQRNTAERQIETQLSKLDYQQAAGLISDKEYWNSVLSIEEERLLTIEQGTDAYWKQALAIENIKNKLKETGQITIEEKTNTQDWLQVASVGLGSLGSLFSGLADLQDTTTKQGIEQQAKFQYMAALMNTANAILGAWTSSMSLPAPASFVLAGIQTAAAAAMGAIQIAQIQKSAQQAGANLSGSAASVSNSGISSITAPVQYTQDVNAAYIGKQISDSKMYVSVTEIDRVSNRVNVAESESKY